MESTPLINFGTRLHVFLKLKFPSSTESGANFPPVHAGNDSVVMVLLQDMMNGMLVVCCLTSSLLQQMPSQVLCDWYQHYPIMTLLLFLPSLSLYCEHHQNVDMLADLTTTAHPYVMLAAWSIFTQLVHQFSELFFCLHKIPSIIWHHLLLKNHSACHFIQCI